MAPPRPRAVHGPGPGGPGPCFQLIGTDRWQHGRDARLRYCSAAALGPPPASSAEVSSRVRALPRKNSGLPWVLGDAAWLIHLFGGIRWPQTEPQSPFFTRDRPLRLRRGAEGGARPFTGELQVSPCVTTRSYANNPDGIVAGTQGLERLLPATLRRGWLGTHGPSLNLLVQAGALRRARPAPIRPLANPVCSLLRELQPAGGGVMSPLTEQAMGTGFNASGAAISWRLQDSSQAWRLPWGKRLRPAARICTSSRTWAQGPTPSGSNFFPSNASPAPSMACSRPLTDARRLAPQCGRWWNSRPQGWTDGLRPFRPGHPGSARSTFADWRTMVPPQAARQSAQAVPEPKGRPKLHVLRTNQIPAAGWCGQLFAPPICRSACRPVASLLRPDRSALFMAAVGEPWPMTTWRSLCPYRPAGSGPGTTLRFPHAHVRWGRHSPLLRRSLG